MGVQMGRLAGIVGLILFCATSAGAQGVPGVYPTSSSLQVGITYTFVDFQQAPAITAYDSGVAGSVVYYRDWIGVEGNVSDVFGSQGGKTTQLFFGGAGLRVRWQGSQSYEPWAHLIVGATHASPKIFSDDTDFGFKAGAGVDFHPGHSRLGFRVSADLLGTQLFGTYQMSPEISAGIVFSVGRH